MLETVCPKLHEVEMSPGSSMNASCCSAWPPCSPFLALGCMVASFCAAGGGGGGAKGNCSMRQMLPHALTFGLREVLRCPMSWKPHGSAVYVYEPPMNSRVSKSFRVSGGVGGRLFGPSAIPIASSQERLPSYPLQRGDVCIRAARGPAVRAAEWSLRGIGLCWRNPWRRCSPQSRKARPAAMPCLHCVIVILASTVEVAWALPQKT